MSSPEVDICVLCHNRADVTGPFLRNIAENTTGVDYTLTVLDNGSTDQTHKLLWWYWLNTRRWVPWAQFKGTPFTYVKGRGNLGFAGGNNYLAKRGKAPWILFCNNDVFPKNPQWLWDLWYSTLPIIGDYDAIGPTSDNVLGLQHEKFNDGTWPEHHRAKFLSGFCMLIRREAFEAVNGWNERFFNGDEDLDISIRLRRAGYKLGIDRNVWVRHLCSQSLSPYVEKQGLTVKEWFQATRAQLHALYGRGVEGDLFEWESLRQPPEKWPELGVLPNGEYFQLPGGHAAQHAAIRQLYHPRDEEDVQGTEAGDPASSSARELHPWRHTLSGAGDERTLTVVRRRQGKEVREMVAG